MAASTFREGALKTSAANPIASNWSRGWQLVLDQPAQDLRGLPAQGLFGVGNAGALVFPFAFGKHCTAVPATTRRHRRRPGNNVAALLVAREVDDVLHWPYDFLNHWLSHGSFCQRYGRKPSRKRSVLRSNFSGAIERRSPGVSTTFLTSIAGRNRPIYSHFFHLKYM